METYGNMRMMWCGAYKNYCSHVDPEKGCRDTDD